MQLLAVHCFRSVSAKELSFLALSLLSNFSGNHYIHIFWSDVPLMNSPFLGYALPQHVDASKIILTGRGLREAVVREEAEFMIDGSQAGQGMFYRYSCI